MWGKKGQKSKHSDLFHGLLRGGGDGNHPFGASERFPTVEAIAGDPSLQFGMDNAGGKLFLGLVNATMRPLGQAYTAQGGQLIGIGDDRHAMIVAGSRAGKGRSLLLPILATWPGSVIVIDPKLDLATDTASLRASRFNQQVQVIDPFGVAGETCNPFLSCGNPLTYLIGEDEDDLIDLATLIADGIIVRGDRGEAHWDESARMFLEAVILHVLTYPKYAKDRTLDTVYELIMTKAEDGEENEDTGAKAPSSLAWEMAENESVGGAVISGMASFYDKSDRERSSVLSTLRRHIHFLSYRKIKRVLANGPVDPRKLHDTPTSLYLGLPATKLRSCAGLPRLFLNLALAAFEANDARRDFQHQAGRYPCLIVMDEFFSLGRMERIEAAAGQIAGFGVKLLPVLQDMSQLQALYPKSWQTFAANCGVMNFFGNTDLATLEYLEKRLGQTQIINTSRADQSYEAAVMSGATGTSYSVSNHPLMSVPEIARVFNRDDPMCRQLILSAKHGPMILQRVHYDQHSSFKKIFQR